MSVLGKHSGRHAFRSRLTELGYELSDAELNKAFVRFKARTHTHHTPTAVDACLDRWMDKWLEGLVEEEEA